MFIAATASHPDQKTAILAAAGLSPDAARALLERAAAQGSAELGTPDGIHLATVKTLATEQGGQVWITIQPASIAADLFPVPESARYAGTELETSAERARREQDEAAEAAELAEAILAPAHAAQAAAEPTLRDPSTQH